MNKCQVKDSESKEKGKGKVVADEKRTEQKGKAGQHDGKSGSVLKEINDDTRKEEK